MSATFNINGKHLVCDTRSDIGEVTYEVTMGKFSARAFSKHTGTQLMEEIPCEQHQPGCQHKHFRELVAHSPQEMVDMGWLIVIGEAPPKPVDVARSLLKEWMDYGNGMPTELVRRTQEFIDGK